MKYFFILAVILLTAPAYAERLGLATHYGHKGDKWAGSVFACYFKDGKVQRRYTKGAKLRKMDPTVYGVAHKRFPCGTMLKICKVKKTNGKRLCTVAPVVDRGPYWVVPKSCMPGRTPSASCWKRGKSTRGYSIKTAVKRGYLAKIDWKYANVIDLLPRVSKSINLGGWATVTVTPCRNRCRGEVAMLTIED